MCDLIQPSGHCYCRVVHFILRLIDKRDVNNIEFVGKGKLTSVSSSCNL